MAPYAQEAKQLSLLFDYGVASEVEVINWADSQIAAIEVPPAALLELATVQPANTAAIISCLHILSKDAEFWPAFKAALAKLHQYVSGNPREAERIANSLFLTIAPLHNVPKEYSFVYHFDDAFSLAREGVYGEVEMILREFTNELERFTAAKAPSATPFHEPPAA